MAVWLVADSEALSYQVTTTFDTSCAARIRTAPAINYTALYISTWLLTYFIKDIMYVIDILYFLLLFLFLLIVVNLLISKKEWGELLYRVSSGLSTLVVPIPFFELRRTI